jgi:tetratricopeptide (TPR) repeat protein
MPSQDAFVQSVEEALTLIEQPMVLGQRSPLAAPYFLGQHLAANSSTNESRGGVLAHLLRQAARSLSGDQQAVLNVAFFEASQHSPLNELRASALHRSLRTYYRDRTAAVQALAAALGRLVIPPLRAERPRTKAMIGRAEPLAAALAALRSGQSIAITGPAGSGKTTLGANIIANWGTHYRATVTTANLHFWFTIRPSFTDNISAMLFGLCHWLHNLGETSAWQQLIADAGKDKAPLTLSRVRPMLRHDLERIRQRHPDNPQPLLVCIDDVDLLDPQRAEHDRVLDVIRELRDLVPVMLIGQNLILETDHHLPLAGLEHNAVAEMLRHDQFAYLSSDEVERLAIATRGLPALVQLFMLLHQLGEPVDVTLRTIGSGPSADALFQRAWLRLDDATRWLLMQIAVYDDYAPADEWRDAKDQEITTLLVARGLLTLNEHDGIAVTSHARAAVLRRIPGSQRPTMHLQVAQALERRGEYTAAAQHYVQAGLPFQAVALWAERRAEEAERGHAEAALTMLRNIAPEALRNDDEQRVLIALRAELCRKLGVLAEGLQDLSAVAWPVSHPLTPHAETLRGDLYELSSSIEAATAAYESALRALVARREVQEADVYRKLAFINLYRLRDIDRATRFAVQARFWSESFHGMVLEEQGDFAAAQERYEAAAELVAQLEQVASARARNTFDLGRIAMKVGFYEDAAARLRHAIQLYDQAGELAISPTVHMNLSLVLNTAGQFDEALAVATERLQFVQDSGDSYLVSALACNAAESCAHLNRLEEAERYLMLAQRQEEDFHRHYILTAQGMVYLKRHNHAEAERHFTEAIRLAQECEDPFGEAPAWRWLAHARTQQLRWDEAKAALAQARALYLKMGMAHEVTRCDEVLGGIARNT